MTTVSRARTWGIGLLGAAALAAAAVGMTHAMPVQTASAEDGTSTISAAQAKAISPVFAAAQKTEDKLPSFLTAGPQQLDGVVGTSTRLLGQDNGAKVWSALSTNGKACVVSLMPGADEYATMSCSTPETFATQGIGIQAKDAGKTSRVFFVPQGFGPAAGLRSVGTQLLAGDATVAQTTGTTLTRNATSTSARVADASAAPSSITLPAFPSIDAVE